MREEEIERRFWGVSLGLRYWTCPVLARWDTPLCRRGPHAKRRQQASEAVKKLFAGGSPIDHEYAILAP